MLLGLFEHIDLLEHLKSILIVFELLKVAPLSIGEHLILIMLLGIDVKRLFELLYASLLQLSLLTSLVLHLPPEGV